MTPERWQAAKALFEAAASQPHAAQRAYLDERCDGDAALRDEVLAMLDGDHRADRFLDTPLSADTSDGRSDEIRPGSLLGHYRIVSLLGRGGMGHVYLAHDTILRRRVALKVLSSGIGPDDITAGRLLREARLASALDHPNICTVYEIGAAGGVPFIAMQYVHGATLDRLLRGRGALPPRQWLPIALQIADALGAAHAKRVVHRDIKSSNIMVDAGGTVKVLDFGIATLTAGSEETLTSTTATAATAPLGTPSYLSPEQARREPVDARSDIFSFGVVLYEMATASLPFAGKTAADTIAAVVGTPHPPLRREDCPRGLVAIIDRALAKDRADRYPSMGAMRADLAKAAAGIHRPAAHLRRAVVSAVLASLAAVVVAGFVHQRGRAVDTGGVSPETVDARMLAARGQHFLALRTGDGAVKALDYFQRATSRDPAFAVAYAGIAAAYLMQRGYGLAPPSQATARARPAVMKALELDDGLAVAHATLAQVQSFEGEWTAGESSFRRAIAIDPKDATARHWYAMHLAQLGRLDEALAQLTVAVTLAPLSSIVNAERGRILYFMRRDDEAIAQLTSTLELDDRFAVAHLHLGAVYEQKQMYPEALAEFERAKALGGSLAAARIGRVYALSGRREDAEAVMNGLQGESRHGTVPLYALVILAAALGEHQQALTWIEQGQREQPGPWFLKVDPVFGGLRSEPRFQEAIRTAGLGP